MSDQDGPPAPEVRVEPPSARDYLANERTLLAWLRTALTVVGVGFVVDRLALPGAVGRLEALTGVAVVILGGLIAVGGAWSFLRVRRQLASGTYESSVAFNLVVVAGVVIGAALIAVFLVTNRPS